jgi:mono/diheme cytochrome c family protein
MYSAWKGSEGAVKGSRTATILLTILAVLVVLVGAALLFMYSGAYDVAASSPPSGLEHWVVTTVRDHSIEKRIQGLTIPDLEDSARVRRGYVHYRESCADCHGVPGRGREEYAADMNPPPPRFFRTPEDLERMRARRERMRQEAGSRADARRGEREGHEVHEARENFWKIQNGVAMTGMPSFGKTHSDEEIWDLVAFVDALKRGMTADQYQALAASVPADSLEAHEHSHAHEGSGSEPGGGSGG